jgi:hypothetical protein
MSADISVEPLPAGSEGRLVAFSANPKNIFSA